MLLSWPSRSFLFKILLSFSSSSLEDKSSGQKHQISRKHIQNQLLKLHNTLLTAKQEKLQFFRRKPQTLRCYKSFFSHVWVIKVYKTEKAIYVGANSNFSRVNTLVNVTGNSRSRLQQEYSLLACLLPCLAAKLSVLVVNSNLFCLPQFFLCQGKCTTLVATLLSLLNNSLVILKERLVELIITLH